MSLSNLLPEDSAHEPIESVVDLAWTWVAASSASPRPTVLFDQDAPE
jgi:hypothetical protein